MERNEQQISSVLRLTKFDEIIEDPLTGEQWVDPYFFHVTRGLGEDTIARYTKDVKTTDGITGTGRQLKLINYKEAEAALMPFWTLPHADRTTGVFVNEDGRWGSENNLVNKYKISYDKAGRILSNARKMPGRDATGNLGTLYNYDDIQPELDRFLSLPKVDKKTGIYTDNGGRRWVSARYLADLCEVDPKSIAVVIDVGTGSTIQSEEDQAPDEPEKGRVKSKPAKISRIPGRDKVNKEVDLYSLDEAEAILLPIIKLPVYDGKTGYYEDDNGRRWAPLLYFFKTHDIRYDQLNLYAKSVSAIDGRRGLQKTVLYDVEEMLSHFRSNLDLPKADAETKVFTDDSGQEWIPGNQAIVRFGIRHPALARAERKGLVRTMTARRSASKTGLLYNLEDVGRLAERKKDQADILEAELSELISRSDGSSPDRTVLLNLAGLFGYSRVVDILYIFKPQFKGIPVEKVKSILGDYLGDFLAVKTTFNPDDLEHGIEYLSNTTLREGLIEVIKDACLARVNEVRKVSEDKLGLHELSIVGDYLDGIAAQTGRFNSPELNAILGEVEEYYLAVCYHELPANMRESLTEDRKFPDLNQRINMQEIAEKKRMLVADEMGLGKSASAIFAKESLGLKQAVVVAPSNVIATWENYLSDRLRDDGEPIGYFKQGEAPEVLTATNANDLANGKVETAEYILLSHERLTDEYTTVLERLDPDMLIIDEAHKLKDIADGVRAKNLLRLAERVEGESKYCVMLSGTPVPNKVQDIALYLKVLYPEQFRETDNAQLVRQIINGDIIDIRSLLVPRMQAKELADSIELPPKTEQVVETELSQLEKEVYEVLMEEDELEAFQKMAILRRFLINPEVLDIYPENDEGWAKLRALQLELDGAFTQHDKVAVFVNGYVEDVLRGDRQIIQSLKLPNDVEIRVIHGNISQTERLAIQHDINSSDKRMVVFISGSTADVGVDYSGCQTVIEYNEPWTLADKRQQVARVYRYGVEHPVTVKTMVTKGTIEEGISEYIAAKDRAIHKLIHGIPISELEKELLTTDEKEKGSNLEVNPELAQYYFSSWDRMMKIFGYVKEIGEEEFRKFLQDYGNDYAGCYTDLGSRSYQANANRVVGTVISVMATERAQNPNDLWILDLASGPEMLRKHIASDYQPRVAAIDINESHFRDSDSGRAVVGSISHIPIRQNSLDYVNLNLAFHYTKFVPSRNVYERLQVLTEINRVLKIGGRVILNSIYSVDLKDQEKFDEIIEVLGFRKVDEYCGQARQTDNYLSGMMALEKVEDLDLKETGAADELKGLTFQELTDLIYDDSSGLKFRRTNNRLRDSRKIIKEFELNGKVVPIVFNPEDQRVADEEEEVISRGEALKRTYGSIETIPETEILANNFIRFNNGKRYLLFKKLTTAQGYVVVK